MAIINKTGITNGGTIQAEHVTRIIDALSGVSTDTIIATGSFTGSFKGDGSQLSGVTAGFPFTGSARITGSLAVTGSFTVRPEFAASFRLPNYTISNSVNYSAGTSHFAAGTIFIVDRSAGTGSGQFTLNEYTASQIGQSYKFIFPYSGTGTVKFKGQVQGVYTDPDNIANNIEDSTEFIINDPSYCVVDATAISGDGSTWFLRVVSNGLI
jgi:hypothetical protein